MYMFMNTYIHQILLFCNSPLCLLPTTETKLDQVYFLLVNANIKKHHLKKKV